MKTMMQMQFSFGRLETFIYLKYFLLRSVLFIPRNFERIFSLVDIPYCGVLFVVVTCGRCSMDGYRDKHCYGDVAIK